jgi:prepilin-type N-terminal cleavage/methylation domain-containing protein
MNERGFTIIELLVTITIMILIVSMSIPAFRQFTSSQNLKSIAQDLKNDARSLHNKALNGIKNSNNERVAWILRISNDASYYETFGCPAANTLGSCKDYLHNYVRTDVNTAFKFYACDHPCTNLSTYSGATFYYEPIDGTVTYYPFNPSTASTYESQVFGVAPNTALSVTKLSILVKSTDTNASTIFTVNSKGDLTEN